MAARRSAVRSARFEGVAEEILSPARPRAGLRRTVELDAFAMTDI
jgi:hypothetical protein